MNANRPAVGTVLTIPAHGTRYNALNGTAPPGYHVGPDGKLWANEETVTVQRVRKVRAGFKTTTTGPVLVLKAGWEATYKAA